MHISYFVNEIRIKYSIPTIELNITMDQKLTMFSNRLNKVFRHRSKLAKKQGISCYRLYDLDMPEFPFCIDIYEELIYVAEYKRNHSLSEEQHQIWLKASVECIAKTLEKPVETIYLKERKVIEERQQQYQKFGQAGREHIVNENGLQFIVNLNDYLDTGLFLDHRLTRKMVGELSKGKCMLNLFAYTASFSVYAAAFGAREVVTIDLSNTYINWAKRNFELNNLKGTDYKFIAGDVLQLLPQMQHAHFDIIVCDPPTFSNSKKNAWFARHPTRSCRHDQCLPRFIDRRWCAVFQYQLFQI